MMSRKERRMAKKDLETLTEEMMEIISDSIEDYNSFILEYENNSYDLKSIFILLSLVAARSDTIQCNGTMSTARFIHDAVEEQSEGLLDTFGLAPLIQVVVEDIYDPPMIFHDIKKTIAIANRYNLYNNGFMRYNLFEFMETCSKRPVINGLEDDSITFTEICHAVVEIKAKYGNFDHLEFTYYIWMLFIACDTFKEKFHPEAEINFEGISDFMEFARILLSYYFYSISEDFPIQLNISGDLYKDLEEIGGEEYIYMLDNILKFSDDIDEDFEDYEDYEEDFETYLLENQKLVLYTELNMNILKNTLLNMCCKSFSVSNDEYLSVIQKNHISELKQINKEIDKSKKLYEKDIKKKEEIIGRLSKEVTKLKTKSNSDYYEKEISMLQEKLKSMENKYEGANIRVKNLENKLEEQNKVKQNNLFYNEDEHDGSEIALTLCDDEEDTITEDTITYEEKIASLQDKTFAVIGGNPMFFEKFKQILPHSKHVDTKNESCNFSIPSSTDCIVNISKYTTHGHLQRAKSQVSSSIPTVNISTYKLEDIINTIYKELL